MRAFPDYLRAKVFELKGPAALLLAIFASIAPLRAETPLERGTYLFRSLLACHTCHDEPARDGQAGRPLAGGAEFRVGNSLLRASNITPDRNTGIGAWTDDQIIAALREGRRPDGSLIGPAMSFDLYRRISDRDARAIVAYLRRVPPAAHEVMPSEYRQPLPDSYGAPVGSVLDAPRDNPVRYGAYLAGPLGECIACHTPLNASGSPDYENALAAGGQAFVINGREILSGNITPDVDTGLGAFSDAQIRRMIVAGIRPNRSRESGLMPHSRFAGLRPADLDAILAYLRSLPPIRNMVDK